MVKLTVIISLLAWQLLPGFCNPGLNPVHKTIYPGQINTSGLLSKAINRNTAYDHTAVQQAFRGSRVATKDNDVGLFTKAFCEIIR